MSKSKIFCAFILGSLSLIACAKQGSVSEPENAATVSSEPSSSDVSSADTLAANEPVSQDVTLSPEPAGNSGPVGISGKGAVPVGETPHASTDPLTDNQIVKITATVDSGEIDQAKAVQKSAKNAQVKKLAAQLLQHHNKSKQKGAALVKKAALTPEDSVVSGELSADAEKNLQLIKNASAAADAERAYVDAQVRQHEAVLDLLDTRLIPNAVDPSLKVQLEETRKMVAEHIEQARTVQQALADSAPATPAG